MKMILRKEVPSLGNYGDVVKVTTGYARNYLIPKGIAVEATSGNLKQFEAEKGAYLRKEVDRKKKAEALKGGIESVTLSFARKAGDDERLFGSVTSHDIEEALKAKGFEVERKEIALKEPIKTIGLHTVTVKLHSEVSADVRIDIVKE